MSLTVLRMNTYDCLNQTHILHFDYCVVAPRGGPIRGTILNPHYKKGVRWASDRTILTELVERVLDLADLEPAALQ